MYAEVLIQYAVKAIDHTFTYHIPDSIKKDVLVGCKVVVPFGNTKINGFVLEILDNTDKDNIKDIIDVIPNIRLNQELMDLGLYIKNKTLSTLVSSYQVMLPSSLKIKKSKSNYDYVKTFITLNVDDKVINDYIENNRGRIKQIEILESLKSGDLLKKNISGSSLNTLLNKGLVKEYQKSFYRIQSESVDNDKKVLTNEQKDAYNQIKKFYGEEKTILLHGITGSGKTEIYMHLIEDVIKDKKRAIVLVPEISLTTQLVQRFYNRFGSNVAIMHSNLSDGEKYDEYKKIERGEVQIVVGTRSAIFVPLNNIGIIIIDEEHTSSYKQENNPRYHAIDIAKWRANRHKCPLVLASATPTFESMARALKGVYYYIKLDKRVNDALLPIVKIVDMADEYKKRNNILSSELQMEIMHTLEKNEQVMILINRRGFSTISLCSSCGYTYKCPNCDITLTYHKSSNNLRCHYCGYTTFLNTVCPNCHEDAVRDYGLGSEKVEEYIKSLYPSYKVVRMDKDTTSRKGSHEEIIKKIENQEYDIIIGTQMISKGLDFPKVTLVGVINADESLNIPDFRSGENTFALLNQVSGRAGRSKYPGKVIIQTFNPDSKTLQYVLKNDYLGNYQYEMDIRKKLKYPPYFYLVSIKVTGREYKEVMKEANKVYSYLIDHVGSMTYCLGPTTASPFRINNIYRFNIIIKYKKDDALFEALSFLDNNYINNKNINFEIDIDPIKI